MLASYNWIKEFVDVKATPEELAEKLTMAGLEVEGSRKVGEGLEKVLTAKILHVDKHPNADRLSLCEVQWGNHKAQVVCGAKNMKAGDVVALALPGAKLPNGMEIKVSKIREVESAGMLCSETELGLAEQSEGILIMDSKIPHGIPLTRALPVRDTLFDINVTPNRADCLSMQGLAREVAANYAKAPKLFPAAIKAEKGKAPVRVKVHDPKLCPRYSCRVLQGVQVGPSPQWMVLRLESCGIRSINNVVDATNYVMLETGQPLHAFDLTQIQGGLIQVRRARAGETMKTLDGELRPLHPDDLVIADQNRILALAGVMGGEDSGVAPETVDLLLESACFSPASVRKSSRRLALGTESSYRFERGVDPNGCLSALDRLAQVILQGAGGRTAGPAVDVYPKKILPKQVKLRLHQIRRVVGAAPPPDRVEKFLKGMGIQIRKLKGGNWQCRIPTSRPDLFREIDLIEEVARLFGYHQIPIDYPKISLNQLTGTASPLFECFDRLRNILTGWGFNETLHYSFTSPTLLQRFGLTVPEELTLINPISEDLSVMRPALFPQMVQTIQDNVFKGSRELKLFEIRPVYHLERQGAQAPFLENWKICLALAGSRRPPHFLEKDERSSLEGFQGLNLLDLKGYLKSLAEGLRPGSVLKEEPSHHPSLHPKRQLQWTLEGSPLGFAGEIHPRLRDQFDLKVPVVLAEISLDLFLTESKISIQFQEISPFPTIWRDLNLLVDEAAPNGKVLATILAHGGPLLKRAELFDVYRGPPLPEGKKALTYRLEYGARERTLTDEEVNGAREDLLKDLHREIGATLR